MNRDADVDATRQRIRLRRIVDLQRKTRGCDTAAPTAISESFVQDVLHADIDRTGSSAAPAAGCRHARALSKLTARSLRRHANGEPIAERRGERAGEHDAGESESIRRATCWSLTAAWSPSLR